MSTRQTLSIFSMLWVVARVDYVVADGHCSKGKDGSQVCVDHMPVAANVVIGVATITILALLITLLICMKRHRGHSHTHTRSLSQPDFIFDSEQMQGPPTIIETHYNPSSGRVDVLSAKSPSFSSSQSGLERKSSEVDPYYARSLPRGPSPALPPRGPSPALPPRAKSPMHNHNRDGVPPALNPAFNPAGQWNPAAPFNPAAQWNPNPNMQMQMTQKQNRLSLPVSFVRMPVPMTAPPAQAQFAFNVGPAAAVGGANAVGGVGSVGPSAMGRGEGGERRPPSYEVETTTYPQPPQTAFVTGNFERPPQHPSLRRTGRYNN